MKKVVKADKLSGHLICIFKAIQSVQKAYGDDSNESLFQALPRFSRQPIARDSSYDERVQHWWGAELLWDRFSLNKEAAIEVHQAFAYLQERQGPLTSEPNVLQVTLGLVLKNHELKDLHEMMPPVTNSKELAELANHLLKASSHPLFKHAFRTDLLKLLAHMSIWRPKEEASFKSWPPLVYSIDPLCNLTIKTKKNILPEVHNHLKALISDKNHELSITLCLTFNFLYAHFQHSRTLSESMKQALPSLMELMFPSSLEEPLRSEVYQGLSNFVRSGEFYIQEPDSIQSLSVGISELNLHTKNYKTLEQLAEESSSDEHDGFHVIDKDTGVDFYNRLEKEPHTVSKEGKSRSLLDLFSRKKTIEDNQHLALPPYVTPPRSRKKTKHKKRI